MKVKRIVANVAAVNLDDATLFYESIFDLTLEMDHGWIKTYSSGEKMTTQISVASEGGSGTPVPDLSIEVDELEMVLQRVISADIHIEYGPVLEQWGGASFLYSRSFWQAY